MKQANNFLCGKYEVDTVLVIIVIIFLVLIVLNNLEVKYFRHANSTTLQVSLLCHLNAYNIEIYKLYS